MKITIILKMDEFNMITIYLILSLTFAFYFFLAIYLLKGYTKFSKLMIYVTFAEAIYIYSEFIIITEIESNENLTKLNSNYLSFLLFGIE